MTAATPPMTMPAIAPDDNVDEDDDGMGVAPLEEGTTVCDVPVNVDDGGITADDDRATVVTVEEDPVSTGTPDETTPDEKTPEEEEDEPATAGQ